MNRRVARFQDPDEQQEKADQQQDVDQIIGRSYYPRDCPRDKQEERNP
jgi:hypothetical protein